MFLRITLFWFAPLIDARQDASAAALLQQANILSLLTSKPSLLNTASQVAATSLLSQVTNPSLSSMLQDDAIASLASAADSLLRTNAGSNVHLTRNISRAVNQLGRAGVLDMSVGESSKQLVEPNMRLAMGRLTNTALTQNVSVFILQVDFLP